EDVGDGEAVAPSDLAYLGHDLGQLGARHDAVEYVVVRRDAADGADRALAAGPEAVAVGLLRRLAHLPRPGPLAHGAGKGGVLRRRFPEALDLDQEDGAGVHWVADVQRRLDGADDLAVDHFQRRGDEAGGDYGGYGLCGLFDRVE